MKKQYMKNLLDEYLGVTVREFVKNSASLPINPSYEDVVDALCSRFSERQMQKYGIGEYIAAYFEEKRKQLQEKIHLCIREAIEEAYPWLNPQADGTYVTEMFADYDARLEHASIQRFLEKDDPHQAFEEYLKWIYSDVEMNERQDLVWKVSAKIHDADLDDDVDSLIEDALMEVIFWEAPAEHFLKQEVRVSIQVDTGTGHCGFYEFDSNNELDENSGILWLVKQQGYSESDFRALLRDEIDTDSRFMASAKQEIENVTYADNVLTFLVRMTVKQLLDLAAATKLQDRHGKIYDTTLIPDCGTITLASDTNCGLYNPWNGSGGPLAIELEKDVVLPIRFIHDLVVEYNSHKIGGPYLMMESFGLCGSAWRDTLKAFNPIKLEECTS